MLLLGCCRRDFLPCGAAFWSAQMQSKVLLLPDPQTPSRPAAAAGTATSDDVATLTRLTQELFTELVKVRARLDELEEEAGISTGSSGAPADATLVGSDGGSRRDKGLAVNGGGGSQQQHARHRLSGTVRLGGGLMWAQVRRGGQALAGLRLSGSAGPCCTTSALRLPAARPALPARPCQPSIVHPVCRRRTMPPPNLALRCRQQASSWAPTCCCSCQGWCAAAGTACTPNAKSTRRLSS